VPHAVRLESLGRDGCDKAYRTPLTGRYLRLKGTASRISTICVSLEKDRPHRRMDPWSCSKRDFSLSPFCHESIGRASPLERFHGEL
jgi:hypothetical protein